MKLKNMETKKKISKIETKTEKKVETKTQNIKVAKVIKTSKAIPAVEVKTVKVTVKNIAESPLKLRLVADMVRGKNVEKAMDEMEFCVKKGALFVKKALKSAAASAKELHGAEKNQIFVSHISVDEAHSMRKYRIASRSRVAALIRRRSHINLIVTVK